MDEELRLTTIGLCEQGQNVRKTGGQLPILVCDDCFYWLVPFKRGSPVFRRPGIGLNEAQHTGELRCRTRWVIGPVVIGQDANVSSFQCTEFDRHGYAWANFC